MTQGSTSQAAQTARDYYNSHDADRFYAAIWGGEDIHIGIYAHPHEAIQPASRRTVARIAAGLTELDDRHHILDIGSGYGGAARVLAQTLGCRVTALNLSEVENQRARQLNLDQGLADRIEVIDGAFEDLPFDDQQFDAVWSQDAILHSGDRGRVFAEVSRVLKPGGHFVFTDPMMADACPAGVLQPILDRIHLQSLGSPRAYRELARTHDLREESFDDLTDQLITHYQRVAQEIDAQPEALADVSPDYLARMKVGLGHWVDGGREGHLCWGIFHFRKG